jgi:hypothetical protein
MAIRANIVGPPRSTTGISASACHSGRSASVVVVQLCKSPRLAMFSNFRAVRQQDRIVEGPTLFSHSGSVCLKPRRSNCAWSSRVDRATPEKSASVRFDGNSAMPPQNPCEFRQTTAEWISHQLTEAYGWKGAPRYIIRDRDAVNGDVFIRRLRAMSIRDRPTAPRSPWQSGYCERAIGSIRREFLDHVVVLGERHLRHLLRSYAAYYNPVS